MFVVGVMGYLSQGDTRVHFGLGDATRVTRVAVRWPDGTQTRVEDVKADQVLVVTREVR